MIRVAIVEDNEAEAKVLSSYIDDWCAKKEKEMIICTVYPDSVKFLEQGSATADIVFMDIEMPFMNGMDAAAEFRKYNRDAILIFATRATKYAVRGYAVDAIGYLVKPIGESALSRILEKALWLYRNRTKRQTLAIKVKDGVARVAADRILYIESEAHQVNVVTESETYQVWGGLDKIKEQLPEQFVSCHRGYIVNLDYVENVTLSRVTITGRPDLVIPISRRKRAEFIEMLINHCTRIMRG